MTSGRRAYATLGILYALPLLFLFEARPVDVWFADVSTALTFLGTAAGLVGATAFAANLILGGRVPPVTRFFGGLEALYRIHRWNGRVAYLLVLMHVLFIVAGRWTTSFASARDLFSPDAGTAVLL